MHQETKVRLSNRANKATVVSKQAKAGCAHFNFGKKILPALFTPLDAHVVPEQHLNLLCAMKKETLITQLNDELALCRQHISSKGLVTYRVTALFRNKICVNLTSQESLTNPLHFCQKVALEVSQINWLHGYQSIIATCDMPFGSCVFEVPIPSSLKTVELPALQKVAS